MFQWRDIEKGRIMNFKLNCLFEMPPVDQLFNYKNFYDKNIVRHSLNCTLFHNLMITCLLYRCWKQIQKQNNKTQLLMSKNFVQKKTYQDKKL